MAKKKPEQAVEASSQPLNSIYTNRTQVDETLAKYLESKGYEFRWINLTKFRNDGFHKTGWIPFKRSDDTPRSTVDELMGSRPDGFIVRGDTVLAIKPVAQADAYRRHLADKSKILHRSKNKNAASQLKSAFKEAQIKAQVHEGYDENE